MRRIVAVVLAPAVSARRISSVRWAERDRDPSATPGKDKEYTDWPPLWAVLDDWVSGPKQR
jgi:hypothetical protein